MVRRGRGRGGGSTQHHDACIRGRGNADANHHFRAAKHRVLGTLLGQYKLGIAFGNIIKVARTDHGVAHGWYGGYGGAAADRHSTMMRASEVAVGDAGSNHYFRAAEHRVLGTLLG